MTSLPQTTQSGMRRANFTQEEKLLLLSLIEKNKSGIVDNYNDGSTSWRKKSDMWKDLTVEFNTISNSYYQRDVRQLRKCWENLKTRYRKLTRDASASEPASLNENDESCDVGDSAENKLLFKKIGSLVTSPDNRNGAVISFEKRFADDISEEIPGTLHSFVFGDKQDNFSAVEKAEDYLTDSKVAPATSMVMEVVEKRENTDIGFVVPQVQSMVQNQAKKSTSQSDDDVSIVETPSANRMTGHSSTTIQSIQGRMERPAFKNVDKSATNVLNSSGFVPPSHTTTATSFSRKRSMLGNSRSLLKNNFRPVHNNQSPRNRTPYLKNNFHAQLRSQASDAEKLLRIRYLRNRIREQEMRLRMMQQKMRLERERHEAVMTLLRKKSAHYETQADRLQDQYNDDSELCDDWLLVDDP